MPDNRATSAGRYSPRPYLPAMQDRVVDRLRWQGERVGEDRGGIGVARGRRQKITVCVPTTTACVTIGTQTVINRWRPSHTAQTVRPGPVVFDSAR